MYFMEMGFCFDFMGKFFFKQIINLFECIYNEVEVVCMEFESGVVFNLFLMFFIEVIEFGIFRFWWYDDNGDVYEDSVFIEVVEGG